MKRIVQLGMMVLLCSSLHADEHEPIAIDQFMMQLTSTNKRKKEYLAGLVQNELYPLHIDCSPEDETDYLSSLPVTSRKISLFDAFQRFVRIFLILLNNHKVQSGVKTVEAAIINLVQIALQVIKISTVSPQGNSQEEIAQQILQTDPALKNAFIITLSRGASTYNPMPSFKRKNHSCCCEKNSKELDQTTQVVLNNFSLIASHFINILQDPENSDNVTPNLIGMLERIVAIGTEVIKSGELDLDTNEQEITNYVNRLDPAFKEELVTTLYRTVQRSYLE